MEHKELSFQKFNQAFKDAEMKQGHYLMGY